MKRNMFLRAGVAAASAFIVAPLSVATRRAQALSSQQRPLYVKLFAGYTIRNLEIAGAGLRIAAQGATYAADTVRMDAISGSVDLGTKALLSGTDSITLSAAGALQVSAQTTASSQPITRRYLGSLQVARHNSTLEVVNLVSLEDYVAGTLAAEASPSWSFEALRAQAIAIRSFAVHAAMAKGTRAFDLKDDTSSQVYRGLDGVTNVYVNAATATRQQILTWRDEPAAVLYSATCGGHTASITELNGQPAAEYLAGVADLDPHGRAYCAAAPYFQWKNILSWDSLARVVSLEPVALVGCSVRERWADGRVKTLSIESDNAPDRSMNGRAFYARCLSLLGYKVVPSTLFEIRRNARDFLITGHGVGHGVGMCQWGARGRADAGFKAAEILQAYFPGSAVQTLTASRWEGS